LLSVDTLRADHVGVFGGDRELTPHLDRLARDAELFPYAFAPAPITLPSVASLLTGLYPDEHGIGLNSNVLPQGIPTIAEILSAHGVATGAVVSNFVLRRAARLDRGFRLYDDDYPQEDPRQLPERIAADTTDAALVTLDRLRSDSDGRVFLWVHYQDPHGPYTPPRGFREAFLERERNARDGRRLLEYGAIPGYQMLGGEREVAFYRAGYDGEVHYLDEQIGRLIEGLSERGLFEDAVVVFTADHGESLGENDRWFMHGGSLTEPLVRIPLMIRVPGRPTGVRPDAASLVDLLPTLLRLYGLEPPATIRGRDLLAPDAEAVTSDVYLTRPADSRHKGLVRDGFLYRVKPDGLGIREFLSPLGEPQEHRGAEEPGRLKAMRESLAAFRRSLVPKAPEDQTLSLRERERLHALGYIAE
jgi:arylsulfatase